jgi:hypothetical protein
MNETVMYRDLSYILSEAPKPRKDKPMIKTPIIIRFLLPMRGINMPTTGEKKIMAME